MDAKEFMRKYEEDRRGTKTGAWQTVPLDSPVGGISVLREAVEKLLDSDQQIFLPSKTLKQGETALVQKRAIRFAQECLSCALFDPVENNEREPNNCGKWLSNTGLCPLDTPNHD